MSQQDNREQKTLNLIHRHSLHIMTEIDRICRLFGISYVALAGTALGAVRHKGFIPWDDDMDIGMLREDYEKFLSVAPAHLPPSFRVHNQETDRDFAAYFSKVCDENTVFIDSETRRLKKYPHHIWVDIFPIDFVPDNPRVRMRHRRKGCFLHELLKCKTLWRVSELASPKRRLLGNIFRPLAHILLIPIPKKWLRKKLDRHLRKYAKSANKHVATEIGGGEKNVALVSDLFPGVDCAFETIKIKVPASYDAVLTKLYGDYMSPPPVDKRYGHMPILVEGENGEKD